MTKKVVGLAVSLIMFFAFMVTLFPDSSVAGDRRISIEIPLGLPDLVEPDDNPMTVAKVELGKMLYFDPRLSKDGTVSCATCHDPDLGYSNASAFGVGVAHAVGGRNTPTVLNAAYYKDQFWDGRAPSLEGQAGGPMTANVEMAGIPDSIVQNLNKIPEYRELSMIAFGEYLSFDNIRKAIAAFERTIIAGNSPFDQFFYGGKSDAISDAAKRGKIVFDDPNKGNCKKCHTYDKNDGFFSDNQYHNVGIGYDTKKPNLGRYEVTKKAEDKGRFKTPTLRNIVHTAPYFHDGRTYSLKEAAKICLNGIKNDNLDPEYKVKRNLTDKELDDLVEFMKALTGELPIYAKPKLPGIDK